MCGWDSPSGNHADDARLDIECQVTSTTVHTRPAGPGLTVYSEAQITLFTKHGNGAERTQTQGLYGPKSRATFGNADAGLSDLVDWRLVELEVVWPEQAPAAVAAPEPQTTPEPAPAVTMRAPGAETTPPKPESASNQPPEAGPETEDSESAPTGDGPSEDPAPSPKPAPAPAQPAPAPVPAPIALPEPKPDPTAEAMKEALVSELANVRMSKEDAEVLGQGFARAGILGTFGLLGVGVGFGLGTGDYVVPNAVFGSMVGAIGLAFGLGAASHGGGEPLAHGSEIWLGPHKAGLPPRWNFRAGLGYRHGSIAANQWAMPFDGERTALSGITWRTSGGIRFVRASVTGTGFWASPDSPSRDLKSTAGMEVSYGGGVQWGYGLVSPWVEWRLATAFFTGPDEEVFLHVGPDRQLVETYAAFGNTFDFTPMRNRREDDGLFGMHLDLEVALRRELGPQVALMLGTTMGPNP